VLNFSKLDRLFQTMSGFLYLCHFNGVSVTEVVHLLRLFTSKEEESLRNYNADWLTRRDLVSNLRMGTLDPI
jgi:hypothetical protein